MDILYSDYKASALHHAYLFPKSQKINDNIIKFVEETLLVPIRANPDVMVLDEGSFTIDSARVLKESESRVPSNGAYRVFLISFDFITREAENALLKVLEEPREGVHFFLMTSSGDKLLSTLRSRLRIADVDESPINNIDIASFLRSSKPDRLEFVKSMVEEKDKARAIIFLNSLESELYSLFKKGELRDVNIFRSIRSARSYMNDRAPSVKMLLENIVLSV